MFINSYGEEFDLMDYMRSLGAGWICTRTFINPNDQDFMIVETKHADRGTMQQGLMLA